MILTHMTEVITPDKEGLRLSPAPLFEMMGT